MLESKHLDETIFICPTILAEGKASEIEKIIKLLESKHLEKTILTCPYILAEGKASEIEKIIKLLESKHLEKTILTCPYILAEGKVNKIEKIIYKVDLINGNIKNISPSLLIDYIRMNNIIDLNRNNISEDDFKKNLKIHLKLIGEYNKIYNTNELLELSNRLKMEYKDFINSLFKYHSLIFKTLEMQNYIWIGDMIPVTEHFLNEYQREIVNIAETVAKIFTKKYNIYNYEEIYDYVMDTLLNRCGSIFINYSKTDALKPMLYKYLIQSCKILFINKEKNIYDGNIENLAEYGHYDDYDFDDEFIQKYYYLSKENQLFMLKMSQFIELGYDYMALLPQEFGMSREEVIKKIEQIRNQIAENIGKQK